MPVNYSKAEKENAIGSIQRFFEEEMEIDIGELQATLALEFFSNELAPLAYNQGIHDARQFLMAKADDLEATCFEEPFTFWKKHR